MNIYKWGAEDSDRKKEHKRSEVQKILWLQSYVPLYLLSTITPFFQKKKK